jgi:carnitine O-acetyltransferase
MLDGTPTLRLNEFMLAGVDKGKIPLELPENEQASGKMAPPEEITFELDAKLRDLIATARTGFGEEMALQGLKASRAHVLLDEAKRNRWSTLLATARS